MTTEDTYRIETNKTRRDNEESKYKEKGRGRFYYHMRPISEGTDPDGKTFLTFEETWFEHTGNLIVPKSRKFDLIFPQR